jgi:hypothetical protein
VEVGFQHIQIFELNEGQKWQYKKSTPKGVFSLYIGMEEKKIENQLLCGSNLLSKYPNIWIEWRAKVPI